MTEEPETTRPRWDTREPRRAGGRFAEEAAKPSETGLLELAAKLTARQRQAAIEGRLRDCPYHHPVGTRCPNCSSWPFKKGGAAQFAAALRAHAQGSKP